MSSARQQLLQRVIDEVAINGLADRSLRELAAAMGTSHRMLLYHFGSRAGLIGAIVETTEQRQRDLLHALAEECSTTRELVLALWDRVSSEELRPFVRLFFESVALGAQPDSEGPTRPWIDQSEGLTSMVGAEFDPVSLRLGVAVTRGLLVDVIAANDTDEATAALHLFVDMWDLWSSRDAPLGS